MGDSEHLTELLSSNNYLRVLILIYIRGLIIVASHVYPFIIHMIGIGKEDAIYRNRAELTNEEERVQVLNERIETLNERLEDGEISKKKAKKGINKAKKEIREIKSEKYDDDNFTRELLEEEDDTRLHDDYLWSLLGMAVIRWVLQLKLIGTWGFWWRALYTSMMIVSVIGNSLITSRTGRVRSWYLVDMSFNLFSMVALVYEWFVGFI